jgi:hypothetical protein
MNVLSCRTHAASLGHSAVLEAIQASKRVSPESVAKVFVFEYLDSHQLHQRESKSGVLMSSSPRTMANLFAPRVKCTKRGPLRKELAAWKRRLALMLLLYVERAFPACRTSDVLRYIVAEWTSFDAVGLPESRCAWGCGCGGTDWERHGDGKRYCEVDGVCYVRRFGP